MDILLLWDSNPFSYGCFHLRVDGKGPSVGGVSVTGDGSEDTKGFLGENRVYVGDDFNMARWTVEKAYKKFHSGGGCQVV